MPDSPSSKTHAGDRQQVPGCSNTVQRVAKRHKGVPHEADPKIANQGARRAVRAGLNMRSRKTGTWMWGQALEMLESAERLQRQFFQPVAGPAGCWEPPVDVYQSGEDLWIFLALPGVLPEQAEVLIEGSTLIVRGERKLPHAAQGATIHRLEIPHGHFERRIGLPAGRYQFLQRVFDNGCLVLGLRPM